jgi:hypothetical protein
MEQTMTPDEMAGELRKLGWTVKAPVTPETCEHPPHARMGTGMIGRDGSGYSEWHCRICGKHERHDYPAAKPQC